MRREKVLGVEQVGSKVVVLLEGQKVVADLVIGKCGWKGDALTAGADGIGSRLRAQLHPQHTRFPRLPFINVQLKLRPAPYLPLSPGGISMVLGAQSYSVLLVPSLGSPLPGVTTPADTIHAALDEGAEYLFCNVTLSTFPGWQPLTGSQWIDRIVRLLGIDHADERLLRAFEGVIPGTVGAWEVVCCSGYLEHSGRVVLMGDAAHAMPPQG